MVLAVELDRMLSPRFGGCYAVAVRRDGRRSATGIAHQIEKRSKMSCAEGEYTRVSRAAVSHVQGEYCGAAALCVSGNLGHEGRERFGPRRVRRPLDCKGCERGLVCSVSSG